MNRRIVIPSVATFVLLTLLVLTLGPHKMRRVQSGFLGMISPFLKTGSSLDKKYREFRDGLKKLDELEAENAQLKRLLAERDLEIDAVRLLFRKNGWSLPSGSRERGF